jgi:hypothetical protein
MYLKIVLIIILLFYAHDTWAKEYDNSVVNMLRCTLPEPNETQKETFEVSQMPEDLSHIPAVIKNKHARVVLYPEKDFKGKPHRLLPGQSVIFAEMKDGQLYWKFQSMKVVQGTLLMLESEGDVPERTDRGFSIGKYDVPDMYKFIKSHDALYTYQGIYMDRHIWNRPFRIHVLTPSDWDKFRMDKYMMCLKKAKKLGVESVSDYCEYALPNKSLNIISGFYGDPI